jgi:hypothetical protein
MTVHAHDPAVPADGARPEPTGRATGTTAARPRWLVPGLAIGIIAATLVIAGVLPFSTVLYAGLIGGMFVMHLGGHGGHGGHGSNSGNGGNGGNGGHGGNAVDEQAPAEARADQARDDDQRPTHGCH